MSIARTTQKFVMQLVFLAVGLLTTPQLLLNAQNPGDGTKPARKVLPPPETLERYFRLCSPENTSTHDCAILERIYSFRLKQLGEAPLLAGTDRQANDIYRITVIFPVATVTSRVARMYMENDGSVTLIAIVSDQNGNAASSKRLILSGTSSEHLRAMLSWKAFSSMDSLGSGKVEHSTRSIEDEGYCLLEGLHDGKFHVAHRSVARADEFSIGIFRYLNELGIWSGLSP
jgi:hypothetical protein